MPEAVNQVKAGRGRPRRTISPSKRFGKLTVIREIEPYIAPSNKRPFRRFLWKCDCGNETEATLNSVVSGSIKSCGCSLVGEARRRLDEQRLGHRVTTGPIEGRVIAALLAIAEPVHALNESERISLAGAIALNQTAMNVVSILSKIVPGVPR